MNNIVTIKGLGSLFIKYVMFLSFPVGVYFILGGSADAQTSSDNEIFLNMLFEVISFNFIRLSELLELLFNYYVMSHSYYLAKFNLNLK